MSVETLTIIQGTTQCIAIPIISPDITQPGWAVKSHIRRSTQDAVLLHEWSTAPLSPLPLHLYTENWLSQPVPGVPTQSLCEIRPGAIILPLLPNVTSLWDWQLGVWDVEVTSPQGQITRIAKARILLNREVTR